MPAVSLLALAPGLNNSLPKHFFNSLLAKEDVLLLQPTRIVPRKCIERSLELAHWLKLPAAVVITHASETRYQSQPWDQYGNCCDDLDYASDVDRPNATGHPARKHCSHLLGSYEVPSTSETENETHTDAASELLVGQVFPVTLLSMLAKRKGTTRRPMMMAGVVISSLRLGTCNRVS